MYPPNSPQPLVEGGRVLIDGHSSVQVKELKDELGRLDETFEEQVDAIRTLKEQVKELEHEVRARKAKRQF